MSGDDNFSYEKDKACCKKVVALNLILQVVGFLCVVLFALGGVYSNDTKFKWFCLSFVPTGDICFISIGFVAMGFLTIGYLGFGIVVIGNSSVGILFAMGQFAVSNFFVMGQFAIGSFVLMAGTGFSLFKLYRVGYGYQPWQFHKGTAPLRRGKLWCCKCCKCWKD